MINKVIYNVIFINIKNISYIKMKKIFKKKSYKINIIIIYN